MATSFGEVEIFGEVPLRPPSARRGEPLRKLLHNRAGNEAWANAKADGKSDAEATEFSRSAARAAMAHMRRKAARQSMRTRIAAQRDSARAWYDSFGRWRLGVEDERAPRWHA